MRTASHILKWAGIIVAIALVLGIIVQVLWNWLMPTIFGLGKITVPQGIGLVALTRILFGRMGQRRDHAGYVTGKYGFRSCLEVVMRAEVRHPILARISDIIV